MKTLSIFVLVCGGLALCADSHAGLILDATFDDGTRTATVASGSTVLIDMVLTDTLFAQPGASSLGFAGLISGGGKLVSTAGTAQASLRSVTSLSNPGAAFGSPVLVPAGGVAAAQVLAPPFVSVGVGQPTVNLLRFELEITGGDGEFVELTSATLGGFFVGNVTGFPAGENLDASLVSPQNTTSVTATVASSPIVPEPMSAGIWLVLVAGTALRSRVRRAA